MISQQQSPVTDEAENIKFQTWVLTSNNLLSINKRARTTIYVAINKKIIIHFLY